MLDLIERFIAGGVIVTAFAFVSAFIPSKSFAGIFGAAPTVALATLLLTFGQQGGHYVATEGRSMILGAVAMLVYGLLVGWLVLRVRWRPLFVAPLSWVAWLIVAFGLWKVLLAP